MDSNAAWRKRRNAFRHPFNPTSLKTFESKISELVDTLDQLLAKSAKAQEIVKIDELFGRFALDVIYNLGFDMQCDYLHDGKKYQELNEGIQLFFQVSTLLTAFILAIDLFTGCGCFGRIELLGHEHSLHSLSPSITISTPSISKIYRITTYDTTISIRDL